MWREGGSPAVSPDWPPRQVAQAYLMFDPLKTGSVGGRGLTGRDACGTGSAGPSSEGPSPTGIPARADGVEARPTNVRFPFYVLIFSIAFAAFFTGPALLNKQFGAYPLVKTGDVLDLFTPLILVPLYWLLFRLEGRKPPGLAATLVFLLLAAFVTLFGLLWGRSKMKQQPLLLFFVTAYLVATLLFAGWGLYWRGFPEFSKVGIID